MEQQRALNAIAKYQVKAERLARKRERLLTKSKMSKGKKGKMDV